MASLVPWLLIGILLGRTDSLSKASKSEIESWEDRQASTLDSKYQSLMEMRMEPHLDSMDDNDFLTLFVQTPRNYSGIVLVLPGVINCWICDQARDIMSSIHYAYHRNQGIQNPKFFFLEFSEDRDTDESIIRKMGIKPQDMLPMLVFIPEYGRLQDLVKLGPNTKARRGALGTRDEIIRWISRQTGVFIKIPQEVPTGRYINTILIMFIGCCWALFFYKNPSWCSRYISKFIALVIMGLTIYFISGFMNPRQRNSSPLPDPLIVFMLYALISCGVIQLIEFGKKSSSFRKRNSYVFWFALGLSAIPFGCLYSKFKQIS